MTGYGWSLGTLFLGALINTFLFGIVLVQYIRYYTADFRDSQWVRATVHTLLTIDITHSAILIYSSWFYIVINFNNPVSLNEPFWAYLITPFMETMSAVLVQSFLARRLFRLNGHKATHTILSFLISLNMILGIASTAQSLLTDRTWAGILLTTKHTYIAWMVLQSVIDTVISTSLAREFYSFRTGSSRSDYVLTLLMKKAIQTGLFATILVISSAVILICARHRTGHLCGMLLMPLGRVYTNALMDTLLMRTNFKEIFSQPENLSKIVARDLENFGGYEVLKADLPKRQSESV